MRVLKAELFSTPKGKAELHLILDVRPHVIGNEISDIQQGKPYEVNLKPYREPKSKDQVGAIWGKIGELADALYASKDEVYEICLRRYGQSIAMRIPVSAVASIEGIFRLVDVKEEREDGTVFVKAYKGLSQMDTAEASRLLEGVLDECEQVGISRVIKHDF